MFNRLSELVGLEPSVDYIIIDSGDMEYEYIYELTASGYGKFMKYSEKF